MLLSGLQESLLPFKWNKDKARHLNPLWAKPVILRMREVLFEALSGIAVVQDGADYS